MEEPDIPSPAKNRSGCRSKALAGCGVIAVFSLGTLFGVLVAVLLLSWIVPRTEGWKTSESQQFLTKYTADQLGLTPEQRTKIDPIVIAMLERRYEMRRDYLIETREMLTTDVLPRIREHLTPEQIEKGNQMMQRWEKENELKLRNDRDEIEREKSNGND